jgi:hypothetical protein
MSGEIAGDSNEDVPTLSGVAPLRELSHAGLEHLIGMEAGVLAQQDPPERRDESLGRMSEREMARDQPGCCIHLLLPIKRIEQSDPEFLRIRRKVVQSLAGLARQTCRRHVEVAGEIDRHSPVKDGAGSLAVNRPISAPGHPFQELVDGIGVGEDVMGCSQSPCSFALPNRATRSAAA